MAVRLFWPPFLFLSYNQRNESPTSVIYSKGSKAEPYEFCVVVMILGSKWTEDWFENYFLIPSTLFHMDFSLFNLFSVCELREKLIIGIRYEITNNIIFPLCISGY